MRTKQGINDLIKGIMIEGGVNVTNLEKTADRIIKALTEENNLIIPNVLHWVAIEEDMPESGQCVMIYSKNGGVAEGAYISAKGHFEQWRWNVIQKDVTHWKPLCEPPCL